MVIRLFYCAGKYTCCVFIRLKQCIIVKKNKTKKNTSQRFSSSSISHQWLMAPIRRKQLQCNGLTSPLPKLIWVQLNAGRHRFEKGFTLFKKNPNTCWILISHQLIQKPFQMLHILPHLSFFFFFCSYVFQASQYIYTSGTKGCILGKTKQKKTWWLWSINNGKGAFFKKDLEAQKHRKGSDKIVKNV